MDAETLDNYLGVYGCLFFSFGTTFMVSTISIVYNVTWHTRQIHMENL